METENNQQYSQCDNNAVFSNKERQFAVLRISLQLTDEFLGYSCAGGPGIWQILYVLGEA